MQVKPALMRRQKGPHPRPFVPGGMVHPQSDDFTLETLDQLLPLRQERFGIAGHSLHDPRLAGQRIDPAENIQPAGALAAGRHHGPPAPLGPQTPQLGVPTIPALVLEEHHPLVTEPQRLAEFFFTICRNFRTPFCVAWT